MSSPQEAAGKYLSETSLRDFGPPPPRDAGEFNLPTYQAKISRHDAPVPVLLRLALQLIGLPHNGPHEKVAWWVTFTYKGFPCELSHQKFGVRLRVGGEHTEEEADALLEEVRRKLLSAVGTVEGLLSETASETLNSGNVTVVNQHVQLRRAYDYFRERATHPVPVEDVSESGTSETGTWWTVLLGRNVMAMHAVHDLVAAISAFVSSLEHDLVLALPFLDFDPAEDDLTNIIGDRWGEKWRRVLGHSDPEAVRLRGRLSEVVERWRNPYSHGGFEKGHSATIYLHTPGVGALPVGLTSIRDSPLFSFHAASESDIEGVFALFDEIDAYVGTRLPHAMEWIDSGLDVRFDADFRSQVVDRLKSEGALEQMIDEHGDDADRIANMDY